MRDLLSSDSRFIGYKCPFFQCDTIMLDHDYCRSIRQRLNTIAGKPLEVSDNVFLDMFKWNFEQFLKKSPTALSVR